MSADRTAVVVLAAGLGTRMKSSVPKVLHRIFDRPMLSYVLDAAAGLNPSKNVIVVNKSMNSINEMIALPQNTVTATQDRQEGTAHALRSALPSLGRFSGTVVIMNGDTPLITASTMKKFLSRHRRAGNAVSVLSFIASDPYGYGRIARERGSKGSPIAIIEEKDATKEQKLICEVNSGVYAMETSALKLLDDIRKNTRKKEFYLTDILSLSVDRGKKAGVYPIGEEREFMGVNSRAELAIAYEALRHRVLDSHVNSGVTLIDRLTTHISPDARIGRDTVVYPGVFIQGSTRIGKGCTIFPGSRIVDSTVKDNVVIKDNSLIEESLVESDAQIGPMAHLRPGAVICRGAKIGNYVEVKKSRIGKNTKAMHLTYIGDATVGENANLGAGTITCNYDGKSKFPTVIGNRVFIGSDSQLVAPVTIGDGAYVGAGSTITRDVEPGSLAVSRTKQKNYRGFRGGRKG